MSESFQAFLKYVKEAPLDVFEKRVKNSTHDFRAVVYRSLIDEVDQVAKTGKISEIVELPEKIKVMLRKRDVDIDFHNDKNETIFHVLANGTHYDALHYTLDVSPRDWIKQQLSSTVRGKVMKVRATFWRRDSAGNNCLEIALATNNDRVADLFLQHEEELAYEINPRTVKLPLSLIVDGNFHPEMVKKVIDAYPKALLDKDYLGEPLHARISKKYKGKSQEERIGVIDHMTKILVCLGDEVELSKL